MNKLVSGIAVVAAASTISIGVVHAGTTYATCATNFICVYDGSNGSSTQYSAAAAAYTLGSMNNKASSISNSRASNRARYYRNQNYLSNNACTSAGDSWSYPTGNFNAYNNDFESMAIETSQFC